jgi:hypothetical protein
MSKATMPERALGKSKFSMYLRTKCDRELYLSLFKHKEEMKKAGIPPPLESRPGINLITKSGQLFEAEQFDLLLNVIPERVLHNSRGAAAVDLSKALATVSDKFFILQPQIEPEDFRDLALSHLKLTPTEIALIPRLSGLKPDAVYVHAPQSGENEIRPDGSRLPILAGEKRLGLSIIDLKNVVEGNPSYSAEVCLYAFFFSNWLASEGAAWANRFYVSDQIYLWKHAEMPNFSAMHSTREGGEVTKRVDALLKDLREGLVDYLIYMPSVAKFFKEDLPRVITQGDQHGWHSVEYHVNPRCSACDWLGNPDWLSREERTELEQSPRDYCFFAAESEDHLSKIANLSKGAAQILSKAGHRKVADLVSMDHKNPVLRTHAILKRDRSHIGQRAAALVSGVYSADAHNKIAALSKSLNAEYDIIVNFDAGSGYLTGIALRGILFAPFEKHFPQADGSGKKLQFLGEEAIVVTKDTTNAEWVALQSFIERLADFVERSNRLFNASPSEQWGNVHTQICFWEQRQYEELCNAFGRHLIRVLGLPERAQRALAWIFPADELMEKEEQLAPGIVFIKDVVDIALRLPVKFAHTLLGVAEVFHWDTMTPRAVDRFYREPLGNAIPRERIFEIWKSTTGTVRMYGREASMSEAVKKYEDTLKAHTWALASVTAKLRSDLAGALQGSAPALKLSEVGGARGVAYDSKLWLKWDEVNGATTNTEDKAKLTASVERLEASYEAIVLNRLTKDLGNNNYEFEVSEDSTEAKLEAGKNRYILGFVDSPGFPLLTGLKLGIKPQSNEDYAQLMTPLYKVIIIYLDEFDRVGKRVRIRLEAGYRMDSVFQELFRRGLVQLTNQRIYILSGMSPDFSDATREILQAVGNPQIAQPAREALVAMGKAASKRIPAGTDPVTSVASILWQPDILAKTFVRSQKDADALATFARTANLDPLDDSQFRAVQSSARKQLAIIWGPPGTGKTNTLTALLHAIVNEANRQARGLKIFITGPNYRSVEELVGRLLENLDRDVMSPADMFWAYAKSRDPKEMKTTRNHLTAQSFRLDRTNAPTQAMHASFANTKKITIISTTIHMAPRLPAHLSGSTAPIQELFDLVIIDESSQVEVTRAIQPMALLKRTGQLIVAGDHLQMPPIAALEAPRNAEYLVGSIQTYFINRFQISTEDLLTNYRSDQHLVDFAKTIGYSQELRAHDTRKKLIQLQPIDTYVTSLPPSIPRTLAYQELLYPERSVTCLIHEDIASSQANEIEAKLVAGLAYCLRNVMAKELDKGNTTTTTPYTDADFFTFGLGIVTPHKAQKALVIKELQQLFLEVNPEWVYDAVDTVERFQGGQRQTIIVSFGVGDVDIIEGEEEFLLQLERTNVAVSRAQAKCIVIMPKSLAYHLPSDQKAAATSHAIKSYIEEFCNHRVKCPVEIGADFRDAEVRWHQ